MKFYSLILAALLLCLSASSLKAQNLTIPDTIFKQILLATPGIDINNDGEVQVMEALNYNNTIDCQGIPVITDLTGIEAFISLRFLYCEGTQITSLDVRNCSNLVRLHCQSTALTSLDLSNNGNLVYLSAHDNNLSSLDLANGNNTNMTYLRTVNNPNLNCIKVDDATFSTTNWGSGNFSVDATTSFNLNCGGGVSINSIPSKEQIGVYPNPVHKKIFLESGKEQVTKIDIFDFSGKIVQSISDGNIKSIDVSFLDQGIYILKFFTQKGISATQFVKQ